MKKTDSGVWRDDGHGRKKTDEVLQWYMDKEREARRLVGLLSEARTINGSKEEIRRLEQALERARYVGD